MNIQNNLHIAFLIGNLQKGGSERVIANMANYWAKMGYKVSIITFDEREPEYTIDYRVKLISLKTCVLRKNKLNSLISYYADIQKVKATLIEIEPNIVIGFLVRYNIIGVFACRLANLPIIISVRANPDFIPFGLKLLRYIAYNKADYLVLQTKGAEARFRKYRVRKAIVRNPVNQNEFKNIVEDKRSPVICSLGRLDKVKNLPLLISAFHEVSKDNPTWSLVIIGDGEEKENLKSLISTLKLEDKVTLIGMVQSPKNYLIQYSIYVLCSDHEGYPNSLIESMSCGMAVISTNCNYGPSEIITNGVNGILLETHEKEELVEKIKLLINNPCLRNSLGNNALTVVTEHSMEKIMTIWLDIIKDVLKGRITI